MKRESRGQQVKTFACHIPQPDLSSTKTTVKVYFQAKDGMFSIFVPEHITAAMPEDLKLPQQGAELREGCISGDTMDPVIKAHSSLLMQYQRLLREKKSRKVISFKLKINATWEPGHDGRHRDDLSFCPAPAIALGYKVLYQIGDDTKRYYQRDNENQALRYAGAPDGEVIDWTAEREEFFTAMVESLDKLIDRLINFEMHLKINPDKAMAALLKGGFAALPAPAKKERA